MRKLSSMERQRGSKASALLKIPLAAGVFACSLLPPSPISTESRSDRTAPPIMTAPEPSREESAVFRPPPPQPVELEEPPAKGPECRDNLCKLAAKGYRKIADLIGFRTRDYRTNRITYEEADRAAGYVLTDLRKMRNCKRLLSFLPDTSVEILRSVHERGMDRKEGERTAYYLYRIVAWTKMKSRRDFDEYMSDLVGREWKDVKHHPQKGFTWQGEEAFYEKHDVPDLKTALHLHRYLKVERYRKHFQDRFRFYGRHPPAPQ